MNLGIGFRDSCIMMTTYSMKPLYHKCSKWHSLIISAGIGYIMCDWPSVSWFLSFSRYLFRRLLLRLSLGTYGSWIEQMTKTTRNLGDFTRAEYRNICLNFSFTHLLHQHFQFCTSFHFTEFGRWMIWIRFTMWSLYPIMIIDVKDSTALISFAFQTCSSLAHRSVEQHHSWIIWSNILW